MLFIIKILIDLSAASHILKEDHLSYNSDVKILDELSAAFSAGGPCAGMTFPQLEVLATCIFERCMSVQAHELAVFPTSRTGQEEAFGRDGGPIDDTSKTHMADPQTSDPQDHVNTSGSDNSNEEMDQNPDEASWDVPCLLDAEMDQVEGDHILANSILLMQDAAIYLELNDAIHDGDTGRVMEVIKVSANAESLEVY